MNVYQRFTTVLQLYFAFFVIQWVRVAVFFVALCAQSENIAKFTDCTGCCQCCYGIAILIILHVFRFQPSGKYVSGDYFTSTQLSNVIQAYHN